MNSKSTESDPRWPVAAGRWWRNDQFQVLLFFLQAIYHRRIPGRAAGRSFGQFVIYWKFLLRQLSIIPHWSLSAFYVPLRALHIFIHWITFEVSLLLLFFASTGGRLDSVRNEHRAPRTIGWYILSEGRSFSSSFFFVFFVLNTHCKNKRHFNCGLPFDHSDWAGKLTSIEEILYCFVGKILEMWWVRCERCSFEMVSIGEGRHTCGGQWWFYEDVGDLRPD